MTATQYLELTAQALGVAYVALSLVARFAPAQWRLTQWCARHGSDVRDLRAQVQELKP